MPERTDPRSILDPFQVAFLTGFFGRPDVKARFVLGGGTALAAFHLGHRLSEDLDLFTRKPDAVGLGALHLGELARDGGFRLEWRRMEETFREGTLSSGDASIKVHLGYDAGQALEPLLEWEGVRYYGLLDLAVRKLSALFERWSWAIRDYVDVYFLIARGPFSFEGLKPLVEQMFPGFSELEFARTVRKISELRTLPRMIVPVTHQELEEFFLSLSDAILQRYAG